MSADFDTPYDQILMWAFNFACDTLDPLDVRFPQVSIRSKEVIFGDAYQAAVIVATLLHIEKFLGEHDYARLHAGVTENIDESVRPRYLASIRNLCEFLLQASNRPHATDNIPSLDELRDKAHEELECLIGRWVAFRLLGHRPNADHELQFAGVVGRLVYSENAPFIASIFLSDGKRIDREF